MQALRKQMRKNPVVVWLAGAGILAIIAVVVIVLSNQGGPPAAVGNYTVRPLSEWSEGELAAALADAENQLIPHARQADGGFVLGFPSAPITVVAFEDFACHFCQNYESEIAKLIETYVVTGRARFEYRFFPTTDQRTGGYHSKLAACVGELAEERFWVAHEFLYARGSSGRLFADDTGRLLAEESGVAYDELLSCTQDVRQVQIDTQLGINIGVRATPMLAFRYADGQMTQAQSAPNFGQLSAIIEAATLR